MKKSKRIIAFLLATVLVLCPILSCAEDIKDEKMPESYTVLKAMRSYIKRMYQFGVSDADLLDAVLLSVLKENESPESFEFLADALTKALDTHSVYLTPEELGTFNENVGGKFAGVGVSLVNIDGYCTIMSILKNTPAETSPLVQGDKIIKVNGENVVNTDIDVIISKIKGPVGTEVVLTILSSDGTIKDVPIIRNTIITPSVDYELNDEGDIAHLVITQFGADTASQFSQKYNEIKELGINKIVIDLRNNTGGFTKQAEKIASMFLPKDAVIYNEHSRALNLTLPFVSENTSPDMSTELVVLINDYTASSSEILTAALKENGRAVVVGENTFGKGTVQTVTSLGDYGSLKITIAEFSSPMKNAINGVGIAPDITVKNTTREITDSDVPPLSFKKKLKIGDMDKEVPYIKQRLYLLGLYGADTESEYFDSELDLAVRRFQQKHNLFPYGVADINTQLTLDTVVKCSEILVDLQLEKAYQILK